MDFTLKSYESLINALQKAGYRFITFEEYCSGLQPNKFVILRHDVDEIAANALKIAILENRYSIKATYFFRIVRQSNIHRNHKGNSISGTRNRLSLRRFVHSQRRFRQGNSFFQNPFGVF